MRYNPERHELRALLSETRRELHALRKEGLRPVRVRDLRRIERSLSRQLLNVAPMINKVGTPYWPKGSFKLSKRRPKSAFQKMLEKGRILQESARGSIKGHAASEYPTFSETQMDPDTILLRDLTPEKIKELLK